MASEFWVSKPRTSNAFTLILVAVACFYLGVNWQGSVYSPFTIASFNLLAASENNSQHGAFSSSRSSFTLINHGNESWYIDVFGTASEVPRGSGLIGGIDLCSPLMRDYVPCRDNVDAVRWLPSTARGENLERHCPDEESIWFCLVPMPKKYKRPVPWPRSKDEVWYDNIPNTRLLADKGSQNLIVLDNDKFRFLGAGTEVVQFGEQYLQQIAKMVPALGFGVHVRVALDVGCGFAGFGTSLLAHDVLTLSIAQKDAYEDQIQFALERGVPAMVALFATHRLPYPSQAFDLIHCSQCRVNWTRDGGILLLEVNRILRAGGYFAWGAQQDKQKENVQEALNDMKDLAIRICWKLVSEEGHVAIWQKPFNNKCYVSRGVGVEPPLCDVHDDPDDIWYVPLKTCISRLPENGLGGSWTKWPQRLYTPPNRLQGVEMDAYISKEEVFTAEAGYWKIFVKSNLHRLGWKLHNVRNVMDMKAKFGGFAAALIAEDADCWVMNVVPVSGPNTLPVIYDRGLIGVAHDWCEPFDTHPRTYDLLHASGLFSIEKRRCEIAYIILEMDRILRPGGHAYIQDSLSILVEIEAIAKSVGWRTIMFDTEEGTYGSRKVLYCQKQVLLDRVIGL